MIAIEVALRTRLFYPGQVRREGTDQEQVGTRAAGPPGHLDPGRPSFSAARRIPILGFTPRKPTASYYFSLANRLSRRCGMVSSSPWSTMVGVSPVFSAGASGS